MKLIITVCLLFFTTSKALGKEVVYLYTYHKKPPFVINQDLQLGLYFDLAKAFSELSERYEFKTNYIPRKRLNVMITEQDFDGVVVGVSPIWFKDKHETKYLWTQGFYPDRDEFVSLKSKPFEYLDGGSLSNKVLGSVAGYYYKVVNEAVNNGQLKRIDTVGELEVLQLLEKQRVQIGLVSQSVFKYLRMKRLVGDIYHFSKKPHDEFVRRAFTTKNNIDIHKEVFTLLGLMLQTGKMQQLISKYE